MGLAAVRLRVVVVGSVCAGQSEGVGRLARSRSVRFVALGEGGVMQAMEGFSNNDNNVLDVINQRISISM